MKKLAFVLTLLGACAIKTLHAAEFFCPAGDVTCLIAAINQANVNGEENFVQLEAGEYRLTTTVDETDGPNGLPSVTGTVTITGSPPNTIISGERARRAFHIAPTGILNLMALTIRNADHTAVFNRGRVTFFSTTLGGTSTSNIGIEPSVLKNFGQAEIRDTDIVSNTQFRNGSAIANESGELTIVNARLINNTSGDGEVANPRATTIFNQAILRIEATSFRENFAGRIGAINNLGDLTVRNSSFTGNRAFALFAAATGAIQNSGTAFIVNSTFAQNTGSSVPIPSIGAIFHTAGQLAIVNSTLAENSGRTGGIQGDSDGAFLQNTILAQNGLSDCTGTIGSLGNNIIGDPTTCNIALLPSDRTGDPGLGALVDTDAPGVGRFPLLEASQAIDAGNTEVCASEPALATDQLDTPRRGPCDIGAIEFYPLVNDLLAIGNVSTDFDPTPVRGGPAGTFRVTAEFTNTSTQTIGHRFAEVVELSGGNLLLNADRGAGGAGARLTSPDSASTLLVPGATETFQFLVGLQTQDPFTFLVNILGDPQNSNPSVAARAQQ